MKPFYRSASFWMATLLTLFAMAPLLRPGYFWAANDARHDVYFILQYNITWGEGVLFPRWSPDWAFGYGYPFFNLVAPAATFLGTVLYRTLPLTLEGAVEGVFIISVLLSAWGMWFFVRDWLGERAALVAAVAYVYVPYHLLDMYVRAAMGETLALALLPFALWAVRRATLRPSLLNIAGLALSYAAIHLTHNFVALMATPLLLAYAAVLALGVVWSRTGWRAKLAGWVRTILPAIAGLGLGLALAAFFVFPALLEFRFVRSDQWYGGYYNFHDHFVYLAQLFDPRWGFGISTPGPDDPISYQLGLAAFVLAAVAFWGWLRKDSRFRLEIGFWLLALLLGVILTTALAAPLWDFVPFVSSAQFPWRYLALAAVALAALAPAVLVQNPGEESENGRDWLAPVLLAGLLILSSAPYLRTEAVEPPPGGATLAGLMEFERSSDEMTGMTSTAEEVATWSPLADLHMAGLPIDSQVDYSLTPQNETLAVAAREHRVDSETVWVHAGDDNQRVPFYRQWFPGWTATILDPDSGAELDRVALTEADTRSPYGLLNVPVPAGDHLLRISFEDTPIRIISDWLSMLALLALVALAIVGIVSARRRRSTP
ncbi:MAG: hypothetical protein J5I90_17055 [Caldilineales bacterium]|nr:hypothetical protein [Caldilineales bacterium]